MPEDIDELAKVVKSDLLEMLTFFVSRRGTILLACEQVERVLCSEKSVIVEDLDGRHPIRIEVSCNLATTTKIGIFKRRILGNRQDGPT